ncbi:MAG TPA: ABC transporter permease [candidate division Zixibacteria bacterium]|nr:ABC transporter permease [candidate division Zixibacteria bacterium]
MRKMWLVARHQFIKEASKRSFILVLLALPLFLVFTIGLGFLISQIEKESATIGFVDHPGLLTRSLPASEGEDIELQAFESRESAISALDNDQIAAFYVIADDYFETQDVELVYNESPPYQAVQLFEDTVRFNLMTGEPDAIVDRMLSGADVTVRVTEANREFAAGNPTFANFLPLIVAAMIGFLVLTTSGYLTEVIVDEKENRTIEIVITSLSTGRMMAGKIMGAIGIAIVQLTIWVAFLVAAIWLGGNVLDIGWLQSIDPNWSDLLKVVIVAVPTYLCIAALMTLIGSSLVDNQEANQAGMLSMLFIFVPIYAFVPIATNPNGPLAIGLTFFPATSITTVALRSLVAEVPTWQIVAAAAIAFSTALLLIWLAGRTFRVAMLRYGQRLKLADLFSRSSKVIET